jgi:hypothetical protein
MLKMRILLHSLFVLLLIGTGITPFSERLQAQAISGDLVGTVADATGAVVPNVTITATNAATNAKATATTNASGQYRLSNLLPGGYKVSAEAPGFSTSIVRDVPVQLNQTKTVNITLTVGAISSSIEVSAAAVLDIVTAQIPLYSSGSRRVC